jgi:thiol-disulfide isomerase/thioredoxin
MIKGAMRLTVAMMITVFAVTAGCSSETETPVVPELNGSETTEQTDNGNSGTDIPEPETPVTPGLNGSETTEQTANGDSGEDTPAAVEIGPQVGKLAPDFTFTESGGKSTSLSDLRGNWVMLNFWATWCGPCKYEMPLIHNLAQDQDRVEEGLVLLTVNSGESADRVRQFLIENEFSFPVLLDIHNAISQAYNVHGIPTTFFIGQDGIINEIKIGAFMNAGELEEVLDRFIK